VRKLIRELESIKGRHTELVSVYVPAGYNLNEMIDQLWEEKSTASNIKSKTTRKNVIAALEKIIQFLRQVKVTPPNGLAVFAGNISPVEGKEDIRLWYIEPPEKLNTKIYWCDQVFVLDPLKDMTREREVYGLITLDAREATIGLLKGKKIVKLKKLTSTVPSKTPKGGMCLFYRTSVLTPEGDKQINKIKEGEKIYSFNFEENRVDISVCKGVSKRTVKDALKIVHEQGFLIVSKEHKIFTPEGEKFADQLKKGDCLLFFDGKGLSNTRIKNIQSYKPEDGTFFYDLELTPIPNFFADGLLVHNSQHRYDRIRDDAINEFLTKVGEIASNAFLEQKDLKGIIIGGPGPVKEKLAKEDYLNYQLRQKILGIKDVGYTDEYGLKELVKSSEDLIEKSAIMKEKSLLAKFFRALKEEGLVTLGYESTKKAIELGAVETLLLSEKFDWKRVKYRCQEGHEKILEINENEIKPSIVCDVCKNSMQIVEKEDISEELADTVKEKGGEVEFISVDTEEGREFKALGGIGAFLRFKIS